MATSNKNANFTLVNKKIFSSPDVVAIADLFERCFAPYTSRINFHWPGLSQARAGNDILLYDQDQLIAALFAFAFEPYSLELVAFVDPGYRRQGLFKRMLAQLKTTAAAKIKQFTVVIPEELSQSREILLHLGAIPSDDEWCMQLDTSSLFTKAKHHRLNIRKAEQRDLADLVALDVCCFNEAPSWAKKRCQLALQAEDRLVFVGELEQRVVAKTHARVMTEKTVLHDIAVEPELQNQGLGAELLLEVIVKLKQQATSTIELLVMANNYPAVALYRKLGFALIACQQTFCFMRNN